MVKDRTLATSEQSQHEFLKSFKTLVPFYRRAAQFDVPSGKTVAAPGAATSFQSSRNPTQALGSFVPPPLFGKITLLPPPTVNVFAIRPPYHRLLPDMSTDGRPFVHPDLTA